MKTITENPVRVLVQEILADKAEKYGVELDNDAKDFDYEADNLMEEIESYIEGLVEQASYPDDPYLYNGVSRSDFF